MTHAWMNFMAVLWTAFVSTSGDPNGVQQKPQEVEYIAVEHISDVSVLAESNHTNAWIERENPTGMREGDAKEWRMENEEIGDRLSKAHARLNRMETTDALDLTL